MFGHVNSLLAMAHAATHAGHTVLFATGADMVDHVLGHGVDAVAVGPTYAESRTRPDEPWPEFFARVASDRAPDLVRVALDWRPGRGAPRGDRARRRGRGIRVRRAARRPWPRHPPPRFWATLVPAVDELGRRWGVERLGTLLPEAIYVDICPASLRPAGPAFWDRVQPARPVSAGAPSGEQLPPRLSELPHASTVHVTLEPCSTTTSTCSGPSSTRSLGSTSTSS